MKAKIPLILIAQVFAIAALEGTTPFLIRRFGELGVVNLSSQVSWASVTMAVSWLFSTLLTPVWGRMSDRVGPAWMLLRAHGGIALGCLAIAFLRDPVSLALVRIVQGGLAGVTPAAMACLMEDDDRPRAIAWVQSASAVGALCGPLIGATFAARGHTAALFFVSGLACLLATASLALVLNKHTIPKKTSTRTASVSVLSHTWPVLLLGAWATCGRSLEDTFIVAWADQLQVQTWGDQGLWMGLVLAAPRLGSLCLQMPWGKWIDQPEEGKWRLFILALIAAGLLTVSQSWVVSFEGLTLVRFLIGTVTPGLSTTIYSLSLGHVSAARRGESIAWASTAQRLGVSLGQGASAFIVGFCQVSLGGAFLVAGCGLGAGAIAAKVLAVRRRP